MYIDPYKVVCQAIVSREGGGEGAIAKAARVKKQNMLNGYAKVCVKQANAPLDMRAKLLQS